MIKPYIYTIAKTIGFIVSAVLLMIVGAFFVILAPAYYQKYTSTDAEKSYLAEYSLSEQKKMGVDCLRIKFQIKNFLAAKITPIVIARKEGQPWYTFVDKELVKELDHHYDDLFTCFRLYNIGQNGRLNYLQDIFFINNLFRTYSMLRILLLESGNTHMRCNSVCANNSFNQIQNSYNKLMVILDEGNQPGNGSIQ